MSEKKDNREHKYAFICLKRLRQASIVIINPQRSAITQYAKTLSACGAVDMWGNVWEWTSSDIIAQVGAEKGKKVKAVKGGAGNSKRTSCRTESREEGRSQNASYDTVGFRVAREK
jgi:formylglycine-generating enzyme required for sulfatase activity